MIPLNSMVPGVVESWNRIHSHRRMLMERFTEEFGHEAQSDNGKLDRVLDTMVGTPKRGRPKGSKNKPKPTVVSPNLIGHIPESDLIIKRGR